GGVWSNYYHAIFEILSCLSIYHNLELRCPVVIPAPALEFHSAALHACGIDRESCVTASETGGAIISRAYCPEPSGGGASRRWWLRIAESFGPPTAPGETVAYLSREHAAARPL